MTYGAKANVSHLAELSPHQFYEVWEDCDSRERWLKKCSLFELCTGWEIGVGVIRSVIFSALKLEKITISLGGVYGFKRRSHRDDG